MKKFTIFIVLAALIGSGIYYYLQEKTPETPTKIEHISIPRKEVEIFDLSKEKVEINLKKPGNSQSYNIVYISAQVAGRITNIPVKVGQKVLEGSTLIELGDSLSTDIMDLNYQTAQQSKNLSNQSQAATENVANATITSAENGVKMAIDAYNNAIKAKNNSKETFYLQYLNTKSDIENAAEAYDKAENKVDDAIDALDDAENDYDDFLDSNPDPTTSAATIQQLKAAIKAAEGQIEALEAAKDGAENAQEKIEQGLDLLTSTSSSQLDQLDYAIKTSMNQYNNAINQYNSAQAAAVLQEIGAANGALQASTGAKSAQLSQDQKTIKSPITGIVTSITGEKNNLTAPGQVIMKVEDNSRIKITSSLTTEEANLVKAGDPIKVILDDQTYAGVILTISPTADAISKKINVAIAITEQHNISAGSLIEVVFTAQSKHTIYLPLGSVTIDGNKKFVRIVDEKSTVQEVEITTGKLIDAYIEVLSGLRGNEKVIKAAGNFLEIDEKVNIAGEQTSPSSKIER